MVKTATTKVVKLKAIPTSEPITFLSVDFTSEGLNDMARKINEVITKINSL